MKIMVCIKQVPAVGDVQIDPETNDLIRMGTPSKLNPLDYHAMAAGLKLKKELGGNLSVITMGPPFAEDILKECLAMGADKAYLVSDRAFGGADTLATGYTLGKAIAFIDDFDLVLTGSESVDGDTGQVGPAVGETLDFAQVTYAKKIEKDGDKLSVLRRVEDGEEIIHCNLPAVITVCRDSETVETPKEDFKSMNVDYTTIDSKTLGADPTRIGKPGSATVVVHVYAPQALDRGMLIEKEPAESADDILSILKENKVL